MKANFNAHRLLKEYQTLAAAGYPGGPEAFSTLADLAEACLANVSHAEWLPATVVVNAFHSLSQDPGEPVVSPALHEALSATLKFLVKGGDATGCLRLSEQLIRAYPKAKDGLSRRP